MTRDVLRESRFLGVITTIVVFYASIVAAVALSRGHGELLIINRSGGLLATLWVTAFAFVFIAYAMDLILRRRPERPLLVMITELRAAVLRPDWLLARSAILVSWFGLMTFFTPFKLMLPELNPFAWDERLAALDRLLFFGVDPWRITHALFGHPAVTFILHAFYNMWFVLMWMAVIFLVMRPERVALRIRYILAFVMCWLVVGSVAAVLLSSAGPCFYERALGDPHFTPLMERLHAMHAELQSTWSGFGIFGLELQDMLWASYSGRTEMVGGGISAMPSMHVSIAVLMACGGYGISRKAGHLLAGFATIIWIGSIHFGWHYAVDGLVSLVLTLGIWKLAGIITERFVLAEPATRPQPALA